MPTHTTHDQTPSAQAHHDQATHEQVSSGTPWTRRHRAGRDQVAIDRLSVPPVQMRIRAHHPDSGNVLTGDVTRLLHPDKAGEPRDYVLVPDGLLEEVVIRSAVWEITELPDAT
jgi:hypothetical protein